MTHKILVIDDSATIREQLHACLTGGGFDVIEACDGVDAESKREGVSMIICDVNMPRMNGIEFVEKHGQEAAPVIMLTSEGQPSLIERAKKAGAKGWLLKPFKPDQLLSVAKKLIG